jgi:uncharacterized protein (UPF0332 family)
MSDDALAKARERMRLAVSVLADAKLLLDAGSARSSVNRAYYAVFYAARALLLTRGLEARKHAGVRSFLDREFVKTGELDRSMSETYHDLFNWRTDADYRDFVEVPMDTAQDLIARAREFVETVQQSLTDGGWLDADPDPQSGSDTDG